MNTLPFEPEPKLDQHLQNVPVPEDLVARLRAIPAQEADVDRQLVEVEVPGDLTERLHLLVKPRPLAVRRTRQRHATRHLSPFARWATAASVLLALGIGWGLWSTGELSTLLPFEIVGQNSNFLSNVPEPRDTTTASLAEGELAWLGPTPQEVQQHSAMTPRPVSGSPEDPRAEIPIDWAQWTQSSLQPAYPAAIPPRSLAEELPEDLMANTFLMQWQSLGANPVISERRRLPELLAASDSPAFFFTEAKGYDRDFLLRESVHPFTRPESSELRKTRVAVSASHTSYDRIVFQAASSPSLATENARMEEWLAATGRFFVPAQPRQLEIRTAAGPSVFASSGTQMLQIGVVAGSIDPEDRPPAHITVAVTPPSSHDEAQRTWLPLKIALREMVDRLRPHDSLTVVVMAEYPYVLVEDVTPKHRDTLLAALDRITPDAEAHLAEGIRLAAATAYAKPGFGDIRRPLLVFSDQFPGLDLATARQLGPLVTSASQDGIDFTWVHQEDERYASILSAPEALEGVGQWIVSNSLQRIGRLLDEAMHGHKTVVGLNPTVEVKWKEKAVERYRLVGYRPVGGVFVPATDTRALHAHESATLLFELTLSEEGPNDIAQVVLTWEDPSGKAKKSTQTISRLQFAPSWQTSALSLQAAQLTAQSLALSQNSYFTRRRGNTVDELETWITSLPPSLRQHVSFPRLEIVLPKISD